MSNYGSWRIAGNLRMGLLFHSLNDGIGPGHSFFEVDGSSA
jgi:hypothetical protein